jgi:hypothetical protein
MMNVSVLGKTPVTFKIVLDCLVHVAVDPVSPYIGVQDSEGLKDKSIPVGNVI